MVNSNANIAILMATYNGETFLREQIDSLFAQTCQDWHLYVHDDGSSDGTVAILQEYKETYPSRLTIMDYPSQGGACKNFLSMLERVEAPYYMFCDQDDVWMPEKVELEYGKFKSLEEETGSKPILVHTDLCLVDRNLNLIDKSFVQNQRIKIEKIVKFEDFAATNVVTGCTMMFNESVKSIIKRPYDNAMMHDAWITMSVAAGEGCIVFVKNPTVSYRQHERNTLGALDMSKVSSYRKVMNVYGIVLSNIRHYREMNSIKPISILSYIKSKIRYKG